MKLPRWAVFALIALVLIDDYVLVFVRAFPSLDARFWYSSAQATALFDSLGPSGRETYFKEEIVDLTLIASYTLLIVHAAYALHRRCALEMKTWLLALCVLPGILDLAETSVIMVTLKSWPSADPRAIPALTFLTPAKWSAGALLALTMLLRLSEKRRISSATSRSGSD